MISSGIIALTPFPVLGENIADDMFLICYNHTSNRGLANSYEQYRQKCGVRRFQTSELLDAILMH